VTDRELAAALNQIRRAAGRAEGGVSDADLLGRFAATGDEAAFELLVRRHQGLVLGVCRRVLQHAQEAEDAFQATFLLLARKAAGISHREALAGWLYKVAYRVALTARRGRAKRAARERPVAAALEVPSPSDAAGSPEGRELRAAVDEEVNRLPGRLRAAAALCYLEGKSVEEAAEQLGCPRGTVASRLARARQRLRSRLTRRGLAPTAGAALPAVGAPAPASENLIRAVARFATPDPQTPVRVAELTEEVLRFMFVKKLTTVVALVVVAGVLLVGGAWAVHLQAVTGPSPPAVTGGGEQEAQRAGRAAGQKPVTVAHPTWQYAKPFEEYLGRLELSEAVSVRARVSGSVSEVHFKAGEVVQKGDLLFEIGPAEVFKVELEKAKVEVAQKTADHKLKETDLQQAVRLHNAQAVPKRTVDQAAAKVDVAANALQVAQAALDAARRNFESTKIVAPVTGRMVERIASSGDRVEANSTILAKVAPAGRIGVRFDMDERSLLRYRRLLGEGKVKESGGPLYVGLADEDGFPREATLDRFDGQVNSKTGTIGVYGTLPNPDGILLPGMSARVRMPFTKQRRALAVPESAVVAEQGKDYVWVVGKGDVAERRAVKAGAKEGRARLIEGGLRPDEWVITGGAEGLRPGEQVEPRRPGAKE
jgi:multidrug efflux system membrane fusion protein